MHDVQRSTFLCDPARVRFLTAWEDIRKALRFCANVYPVRLDGKLVTPLPLAPPRRPA